MKATKKLKTTVEGVTLELTTKDDLRALLDAAERLRDIFGELETDGTGRVEGLDFDDADGLGSFGYDLFNSINKELA